MENKIDIKEEIRRLSLQTKFSQRLLEKDYHWCYDTPEENKWKRKLHI